MWNSIPNFDYSLGRLVFMYALNKDGIYAMTSVAWVDRFTIHYYAPPTLAITTECERIQADLKAQTSTEDSNHV